MPKWVAKGHTERRDKVGETAKRHKIYAILFTDLCKWQIALHISRIFAPPSWWITLNFTERTLCVLKVCEGENGVISHPQSYLYSLLAQYLEPVVDDVLRREGAVVIGEVAHLDALALQRRRVVRRFAHAHHRAHVVLPQLLNRTLKCL